MASTKKSTAKKSAAKKNSPQNKKEKNLRLKEEIRTLKKEQHRENTLSYQLMPYILLFLGVFLIICFAIPDKMGWLKLLPQLFKGLFSAGAYLIPICLIAEAFYWKKDYAGFFVWQRSSLFFGFILSFSALCRLWDASVNKTEATFNPSVLYKAALDGHGGGVIGGFIGGFMENFTGIGAWIICVFAFILLGFASFGITPLDIAAFIANKAREVSYNVNTERQKRLEESVSRQREEDKARVSEANLKSAEEEAKDAKEIRKKRAFIDADDDPGVEETTASSADGLPENEISPVISDDKNLPERAPHSPDPDTPVNVNAYDEIIENNNAKRQSYIGSAEQSPEQSAKPVSLDDIPDENDVPWNTSESTSQNDQSAVTSAVVNAAENAVRQNGAQKTSGQNVTEFSDIFTDGASIAIAGVEAGAKDISSGENAVLSERTAEITDDNPDGTKESIEVSPEPAKEEIYNFPPINFLQKDPNPTTFAVTDELKQTSVKLVETLGNFGVRTKIMNICCGPTVTRYELQPEIGVRVRSIANLSDDIALHLAAAGVRIEAPIPGKDTVGIEIPNKSVSTVYLRNLIENPGFENQKSRLTVCLGMDVAGTPIYMNIAKMPHLLIAGATGMGKSVCINSFIVSLLYKARPDEVKLILVDPKKVELSIYNGLPHLLVPVVSDPKKAAGTLAWAVNEMERRFLLIEEVGVRDLDTYNEVTKNDPEKEYLPKIVIIIDELADLMMTAKVEVETSICRIAQKARAAGMHLVIGTQRPSVDVITGLIKANVPSRIAFTVASQIDSRTIIDVSGAEKLLGRGDMLYAPVGCMKPIRIQGSFVSEKEIENIVSFLKNGHAVEYDADIIESIEREAAKCGEKKKGRGGSSSSDDFDEDDRATILSSDEAIFPAMEIAVESGSVSTSLLQRKLSLGYSRAARIVDKLEKLGVVGPFEGSKPRKVLISYDEYLAMRMNYESDGDE